MKYSLLLLYTILILLILDSCAKQNFFQEPPDYPVIDSIAPARGFVGTQIRLWGSGFSTFTSQDTVRINGVRLRVDSPATSTVLLATLIDSTGTGAVQLSIKGQTAKGPVFTFLGTVVSNDAPVITAADFGWNDARGYSVTVKTLPATDNGIRVLVGGVNVPIAFVVRPGDPRYDPNKGNQILLDNDSIVKSRADGIYANFMVTFNGVPSNTFPLQIKPAITDIFSRRGAYQFAAGDTVTIKGNFFGDRSQLPSSIFIVYNGVPLSQPTILSWTNTEIRAAMPAYPTVPVNTGIPFDIQVGTKTSQQAITLLYLGVVTGPPAGGVYTKIDYTGTDNLSQARQGLAAAGTGGTIIFAGGSNTGYSAVADIYNVRTGTWSTGQLSEARYLLAAAAAGSKIVFAGGYGPTGRSKTVDIYDTASKAWTTAQLSVARDQLSAVGAGNKIYFAGGAVGGNTGTPSKVVDIYDVTTNSWTTAQLSEARYQLCAATAGNKIIFAGGVNGLTNAQSQVVDILDITSNSWTTALLSAPRYQLAAAGAGNKILVAGGVNGITGTAVNRVDIYDVVTNTWSVSQLPTTMGVIAGTAGGNKIVFAGSQDPSYTINGYNVYDVVSNTWTGGQLSGGKGGLAAAAAANKILFAGGASNTAVGVSAIVEIFTLSN